MPDETDLNQLTFEDLGDTLHQRLHSVCRYLPTDFQPYGKRVRTGPDCSRGCKHFLKLPDPLSFDWGVCINPRSPRSGLLTFEHQGCEFFEAAEEAQRQDLDKICCVCRHELSIHIDEGDGWRCHSLAEDGYQCECWLRKGRYDSIEGYSLGLRMREHTEELKATLRNTME